MIAGMFDRLLVRLAPIAVLWLLTGCSVSVTPEPFPSHPTSEPPQQTADLAAAVCGSDPFGCVEVAEGDPILIGTALTLTGPDAPLGLDSQYGAQVALNLRGALLGHDVELVQHDDRCSPDGGTAAANLLVELEGLVAVIGTSCSSAAEPAADILGERGILLVSPSNTAPRLTADAPERFYVRTAPNDLEQGSAMAQFACTEVEVATAATIGDGGEYAEALQEAFASEFGSACDGTVTEQVNITTEGATVDAALARIATSNNGASPDVLYYPLADDLGSLITRRAGETPGLEDTILAGIHIGEDGRVTPELVDGMYLSAPMLTPTGDFYEGSFLEEYRSVSGSDDPIAAFHGHAYDAVNLVLDAVVEVAIEEEGTLHIPRMALRQAILAVQGYEGLTGTFTCDENGDCGDATITVSLVDGGRLEPVWP